MKIQLIAISLIAGLLLVSCAKDSATQATLIVQEKNVATSNLLLTTANIGITEIDFEVEMGGQDVDFDYEDNYAFNLLTGKSTPEIDMIEIEPGMYHELEFYIAPVLPSGNTIELVGTYGNYQFEFVSKMEDDFEIGNVEGAEVVDGEETVLGLFLNLEMLFEGVNFPSAVVDSDGVIRINSESNEGLMDFIESNIENFMEFED